MEPGFDLLRLNQTRRVVLGVLGVVSISAGIALIILTLFHPELIALQLTTGIVFSLTLVAMLWLAMDPDTQAARQSDSLLRLASQMLECMKSGMTPEEAYSLSDIYIMKADECRTPEDVHAAHTEMIEEYSRRMRLVRKTPCSRALLRNMPVVVRGLDRPGRQRAPEDARHRIRTGQDEPLHAAHLLRTFQAACILTQSRPERNRTPVPPGLYGQAVLWYNPAGKR